MTSMNIVGISGGRYGLRSGSGRVKNLQIDGRLNVAGNEIPIMPMNGEVFYVDTNVTASGNGKSWKFAFKTATEGLAALSDYDTLIIGPGNYDEDKLVLTGLTGVKIFGHSTGMQWGEGSTCLRAVASDDDVLDIVGCQAIEIAGICFVVDLAKDAINLKTTLSRCVHIHDCCFIGDCGGTKGLYGIVDQDGSTSPDLFVHDCKFFRWATAGIANLSQRSVISNNFFVVPASGTGVYEANPASGFVLISDNYFLGANSSDYGIYGVAGTRGNFIIANNQFANFNSATGYGILLGTGDYNCVENYRADAAGAVTVVDPEQ